MEAGIIEDPKQVPLLSGEPEPCEQSETLHDAGWRAAERPPEINSSLLSVVQMVNTMLGSGVLAFPYVFAETGLVLGFALVGLFGSMSYFTNCMNLEAGAAVGTPAGDMSEILQKALRSKRWRRVVDACVAIQAFGSLLSYNNVMGNLGAAIFASTRPPDVAVNTYPGVIVVCTLLLSPFCYLRTYGELATVSLVSYALIFTTTISIFLKGFVFDEHIYALPWRPKSVVRAVTVLGNFAFSTSNQFAVHEMYASMRPSERPSISRVLIVQATVVCATLGVMAVGGLAAIGANEISANVLDGLKAASPLARTLSVFTVVHLMCYIPNDFIIMRLFACRLVDVNPLQIPPKKYFCLTTALVAVPALTMAVIPRDDVVGVFELVIALTGEIPVVICAFLAPCLAFKAAVLDGDDKTKMTAARDDEDRLGDDRLSLGTTPSASLGLTATATTTMTTGGASSINNPLLVPHGSGGATPSEDPAGGDGDTVTKNGAKTTSLFPILRRHPCITYFYIGVSLVVLVVAPVVTIYQFASDCLDRSCADFGSRRRLRF